MKAIWTVWNCIHWLTTFSISLSHVLRSMIGQNDLDESYFFLFGFGMITNVDCLKWDGQYPSSKYHKWPLTDLWLVDLIIKVLKKAKLDKQQKMLLSLRFILRHIVLKYMIVVVCAPEQPTIWSLPIVLHIGLLLFLK